MAYFSILKNKLFKNKNTTILNQIQKKMGKN